MIKKWDKLSYPGYVRILLVLMQAAAVAVLALCLLSILQWRQDWGGLREAAGDYLETSFFFRRVDEIVEHKVQGRQNRILFESDGSFDELKEVDIQSFGQTNTNFQDLNTTYLLQDLLSFEENGGRQRLHEAIEAAVRDGNRNRTAGELLAEQSGQLETVLPVTEISLAECSKWYTNSTDFVLDMYQKLDEVCLQLSAAYQSYSNQQDESWAEDAPSNLRYCILNKATGDLYTNLPVSGYDEAKEKLKAQTQFRILFEGERSYNVMVADPEASPGEEALQWFQKQRYVSSNEKVLLAVDPDFPVADELKEDSEQFARLGSSLTASALTACGALAVLITGFVLSVLSTGHEERRRETRLYSVDKVPSELALAIYMVLLVLLIAAFRSDLRFWPAATGRKGKLVLIEAGYLLLLSACTGLARRVQRKTLWSNSISRMLIQSWKQVTSTRLLSGRFLVIYIAFFALHILLLVLFGRAGVFLVLILDVLALLYLLRDLVGRQSVWEGIHQISRGDLAYKIDVTSLQGDTYEIARAINDMGDGLQEAVESLLKNERLKAELITNVSHDLKTPLTSIVNYVDLLKKEQPENEKMRQYIEILDQKSQRLKQLTEDLVEASRISSGNVQLDMMRLPFKEILQQACGEFSDRFEERHLQVKLRMEDGPMWIRADGSQLWRVLENLMSNVCKYAREGTDFDIRLQRNAGKKEICLVMENETEHELQIPQGNLTERFVRGDTSRSTEGSGLGLSIASSLTELMGGKLKVGSEGTHFTAEVTFPDEGEDK